MAETTFAPNEAQKTALGRWSDAVDLANAHGGIDGYILHADTLSSALADCLDAKVPHEVTNAISRQSYRDAGKGETRR